MNRVLPILIIGLMLLSADMGLSDELSYVSDGELAAEIERRAADVIRTTERLDALEQEASAALRELDTATAHAEKTEQMVSARAKVYYRFSRRGKALKYLMGASSPVQVLKRFNQLRYLLEDGVKDRQRAIMRLENGQSQLDRLGDERTQARALLTMLQEALADLHAERRRRSSAGDGLE